MADSLMFNKIAGATLATGLLIFGLSNAMGIIFEQAPPTKPGDAIAIQEDTEGAAPADVPPDWGTVLPKADIAAGQAITSKCASCHQFDPGDTPSTGPGLYGVVGRDFALAHLLEQFANGFSVHVRLARMGLGIPSGGL